LSIERDHLFRAFDFVDGAVRARHEIERIYNALGCITVPTRDVVPFTKELLAAEVALVAIFDELADLVPFPPFGDPDVP
jgi:hypothetical protein